MKKLMMIVKIVNSLEESDLLVKGIREIIKNEVKEQKGGFLGMLSSTLGASLLENMLVDKGVMRAGKGSIRAAEDTIRAGQDF